MAPTRRHRNKRQKTRKTKQRGGAILGRGTFGVVFRPPLICSPLLAEFATNDQVGKLQDPEQEENEIRVSEILKELDPEMEHTIPILASCDIGEVQTNENQKKNMNQSFNENRNNQTISDQTKQTRQIISKQGGPNVQEWLDDYFRVPTPSMTARVSWLAGLSRFFRALKEFLTFLKKFNKSEIHNDLHLRNLVQDGEHVRMIDFGITEPRKEKEKRLYAKMNKNTKKINNKLDMLDVAMLYNDLREFFEERPIVARMGFPLRTWQSDKQAPEPLTADKIQASLYALPE